MTEKPNLEELLNAITGIDKEKRSLVERYLTNPDKLDEHQKRYVEDFFVNKYPHLFRSTKKKSLMHKIWLGVLTLALGLCIGYCCRLPKTGQRIEFNSNGKVSCFPENVTFKMVYAPDAVLLEDFYNYKKSRNQLDHNAFVRDLYFLDGRGENGIDGNIPKGVVNDYIAKHLDSK